MVRLILREVNPGAAINVGGPVLVSHRTIDVDIPELERWLDEPRVLLHDHYITREVIGVEIITKAEGS
jgi:hypothetical protein